VRQPDGPFLWLNFFFTLGHYSNHSSPWLAFCVSGAKIKAQKSKKWANILLPQTPTWVYYARITFGHNSPADWARELFKPSKDVKSLVACNKKLFQFLDVTFLFVNMIGVCLCISSIQCDDVIAPGSDQKSWFCGSVFCWILGYLTSLQSPW